jgi:hypothetical protein
VLCGFTLIFDINRLLVEFIGKCLLPTNTTVISAAIAVSSNTYCRVLVNTILFANTGAITAAIAEQPLLLQALSLPPSLPLC